MQNLLANLLPNLAQSPQSPKLLLQLLKKRQ
jgi:hypothetical protein